MLLKTKKEGRMIEENDQWTLTPEEDLETGDLILTFPPELLEKVGWQEGDTLNWSVRDDGSVYLTKKEGRMIEEINQWTLTPEEDPETGDLILTFPPELLEKVGWQEGDTLNWSVRDDGSVYLTKKEVDDNIATL